MTTARDVIAKALWENASNREWGAWENCGGKWQDGWRKSADAAIAAVLSAPEPVRLELAALLSPGRSMSPGRSINPWRPIETAPKDEDETSILIGNNRHNDCRVAYYEHDADPTYPWHVEDAAKGFNHHRDWPTHWMPRPALPAPPPEEKREHWTTELARKYGHD